MRQEESCTVIRGLTDSLKVVTIRSLKQRNNKLKYKNNRHRVNKIKFFRHSISYSNTLIYITVIIKFHVFLNSLKRKCS